MTKLPSALTAVSIAETLSFLVLLGAMVSGSAAAVSIVGAVHGMLFLLYVMMVLAGRKVLGWSWGYAILVILTGPIGAVLALERLRRERSSAQAAALE